MGGLCSPHSRPAMWGVGMRWVWGVALIPLSPGLRPPCALRWLCGVDCRGPVSVQARHTVGAQWKAE